MNTVLESQGKNLNPKQIDTDKSINQSSKKKKKKWKASKINLKIYKVISILYARRIKLSRDGEFLPWI